MRKKIGVVVGMAVIVLAVTVLVVVYGGLMVHVLRSAAII